MESTEATTAAETVAAVVAPTDPTEQQQIGVKLAPYNPTNIDAVHIALDMLALESSDIFYDLGCGDGRLLIEASDRHGVKALGVEYDVKLAQTATANVAQRGLQEKVAVVHDNVLNVSISPATAIFVYLVPEGMKAMKPALVEALERGVRVVTYVFSIVGLTPVKVRLGVVCTALKPYDNKSQFGQVMTYKGSTKMYLYKKESVVSEQAASIS